MRDDLSHRLLKHGGHEIGFEKLIGRIPVIYPLVDIKRSEQIMQKETEFHCRRTGSVRLIHPAFRRRRCSLLNSAAALDDTHFPHNWRVKLFSFRLLQKEPIKGESICCCRFIHIINLLTGEKIISRGPHSSEQCWSLLNYVLLSWAASIKTYIFNCWDYCRCNW